MTRVVNNLHHHHPDLEVLVYGQHQPVITINRGGVFVARITLSASTVPGPPVEILLAEPSAPRTDDLCSFNRLIQHRRLPSPKGS